ncbi:tetratricopeptide repeat protein [Actinomyces naeslundii]|uniref:NB-ARC domain protein n=1 Tax=Actinomyces naeslundii (strain ATCC 12104 / DSM 43013 / CCUG 2238 / JCM 8349 / NCTC 10301 / Howell 279) TaxID=1115803 RepID=J2ZRH8_ACTNH|nr:tetratricopeptide repeat protein [Actinomyces naeslundii]EJN85180.1 NB-ARC domain protein [Actinomyces naeslundii str. Howell 279]
MADPLSLFALSASITGLLMRGAAVAVDPSWSSAASLPSDALNAWRSLRRLQQGRGGEENPLEASIKSRLQKQVDAAHERYERTSVTQSALAGAVTEIEVALRDLSEDETTVLEAVRFPDHFERYLRRRTAGRRQNIEAAAEPFFDDLTRIVADEFIYRAPGSRAFDIAALKQLLAGQEQLLAGQERLIDQYTKTYERLDRIIDSIDNIRNTRGQLHATPTRIHFGSRPMVATNFIPRTGQNQLVNAIFFHNEPRTVLTGMKGSGKTQLAATIAAKCEDEEWPLVAWINAASRKKLVATLYELATLTGIDAPHDKTPDFTARRFLDKLRSADAADRLFIFDNVENLDDLKDLTPEGKGVRVIITTTRHLDWDSLGWHPITVGVFERDQSITLLCERTGDTNRDAANQIASTLGDLPVAITQAAATARNERFTLNEYLRSLNSLPLADTIDKQEGEHYPKAISTALWLACKATIDSIKKKNSTQGQLSIHQISTLSLLAAPGVPTAWLEDYNDTENAKKSLSALLNSSVCQISADSKKTLIHRLQGRVFRENRLSTEIEMNAAVSVAISVLESISAHTQDSPSKEQQETHNLIEQLSTIASQEHSLPLFSDPTIATILARTLKKAWRLGMHQIALALINPLTKASEALGVDHPDIITSRNSLADAYLLEGQTEKAVALVQQNLKHSTTLIGSTEPAILTSLSTLAKASRDRGDLEGAASLFEQILTDRIRILGPNHPDILTSRNSLAGTQQELGRLEEAITLYEKNFEDSERILGPHHPGTLTFRNNLAGAYQDLGRLGEAINLLEQNLKDRTLILGPDHPDTLASRHNLANAYQAAGRFDEAITLHQQNLEDSIRILGPDHPDTLASRHNLANAYREMGRLDEAITLHQQNLEDSIHILGPDHPDTLASRHNLANAYQAAGRLDEAITLHQQNLEDSIHILGPHHPHTLTSRHNLAVAYHDAGRLNEAITLQEQNLKDFKNLLGPNHPHTLTSRHNLANAYQAAGRLDEAITLYEQNLKDSEDLLGPHHPHTLASRNNLASAYQDAGRLDKAIPLYEQTLEDRTRILGPHHPHTLASRNNLASAYQDAGRLDKAIPLLEQTLEDSTHILGPHHPSTLTSRNNLAEAYRAAGRIEDAEKLFETPSGSEQDGTEEDPDQMTGD